MTTTQQTRTRRERFLPYAHDRLGLTCRVTRVEVDGREGPEPNLDRRVVSLDDPSFETVRVRGVVAVPEATLRTVFPDSEQATPMGRLSLVWRCAPTRVRRAVSLGGPPVSMSEVPFVVEMAREEVEGSVELRPMLERAARGSFRSPGYAAEHGTRLASGRAWTVRVDPASETKGRFLDIRYRRFSEDVGLKPWADTLFRLEVNEQPTLWINADHERVQRALDDRGTRGVAARVREVAFDSVAHAVWMQLFLQASLDLKETGELLYSWQESVLRELLPSLIRTERNHPARLAELRARIARGELGDLVAQLSSLLQRKNTLASHLDRLVHETVGRNP